VTRYAEFEDIIFDGINQFAEVKPKTGPGKGVKTPYWPGKLCMVKTPYYDFVV